MLKQLLVLLLVLTAAPVVGQIYLVNIDSVKTTTFQIGKTYKVQTIKGITFKSPLLKLANDTFYFAEGNYHYSKIGRVRNKKRKDLLDAILFPATLGSCLAMSALPINYISGYFRADTESMFRTLGLFIGESIIFAISRSYLSKNKRWIEMSHLKELKVIEKK